MAVELQLQRHIRGGCAARIKGEQALCSQRTGRQTHAFKDRIRVQTPRRQVAVGLLWCPTKPLRIEDYARLARIHDGARLR